MSVPTETSLGGGAIHDEESKDPLPMVDSFLHFSSTWGPPKDQCMFPSLDLLPFRSFNRNAKIGKVADFGSYLRNAMRGRFSRSQGEQHSELDLRGGVGPDDEDGGLFIRVDNVKVPKKTIGWAGKGGIKPRPQTGKDDRVGQRGTDSTEGNSYNKRFLRLTRARRVTGETGFRPQQSTRREFSVKIQPDWTQLESVELSKVRFHVCSAPAPAFHCVCVCVCLHVCLWWGQ